MRRAGAILAALVASVAWAGSNGVGTGGLQGFPQVPQITDSQATSSVVLATTAAMTLYVDPTGNDSGLCGSTGAGACLTIQGAINKVPKLLRHGVTVNVAAGTYGCAYVSGFTCDTGIQQTTGGLMIDGLAAFTNSTLATGTATGTATASSAGSGTTYGTLTDSGQSWTSNDLTGRFVTVGSQTRLISSNTSTVITIVGTWTNPGTVAYTIQDPGVLINTACNAPASPLAASSAFGAALIFTDNNCQQSASGELVVRGIRTSNSSGGGIYVNDPGSFRLTTSQIRSSGGAVSGFETSSTLTSFGGGSGVILGDSDFSSSSSGAYISLRAAGGNNTLQRILVRGGANGLASLFGSTATVSGAIDFQGQTASAATVGGSGTTLGGNLSLSGAHITCSSGAGVGVIVGGSTATTQSTTATLVVTSGVMSTCGTGVIVNGVLATAELTALTGSAATTGISALSGGSVSFSRSGTTMTGGTNDISLDSGGVTAALGDIAAATCLTSASTTSQVCGR